MLEVKDKASAFANCIYQRNRNFTTAILVEELYFVLLRFRSILANKKSKTLFSLNKKIFWKK